MRDKTAKFIMSISEMTILMIHKHRGNRRRIRMIKSHRKSYILNNVLRCKSPEHISELSKAKIHCSCPLCAAKSKHTMGIRYRSQDCWSISDRRKFDSMNDKIKELEYDVVCT